MKKRFLHMLLTTVLIFSSMNITVKASGIPAETSISKDFARSATDMSNIRSYTSSASTVVTEWPATEGISGGNWLIEGDYTLGNSNYNLAGEENTLTINGNLTISSYAYLKITSSKSNLIVKGNLIIDDCSDGGVFISGTESSITVEGDCNASFRSPNDLSMTGSKNSFVVKGNLTLTLRNEYNAMELKGVQNTFLVNGNAALKSLTNYSHTGILISESSSFTVNGDLTIDSGTLRVSSGSHCDIYGNLTMNGGQIGAGRSDDTAINGSVTVKKNLIQNAGTIYLGKGTLDINGNYTQNAGYIRDLDSASTNKDKGTLHIHGDFIQKDGDNSFGGIFNVDGNFTMGTKGSTKNGYRLATSNGSTCAALLTIGGDLTICTTGELSVYSSYDHEWNDNRIILKGDLYQYGNYTLSNNATYGYAAADDLECNISFEGTQKQHIYLESLQSSFNCISATNTLLQVDSPIGFKNQESDITFSIDGNSAYNAFFMDPLSKSELKGHTLVIQGNARQDSAEICYYNSKITVTGDYVLGGVLGNVYGSKWNLEIRGNLIENDGTLYCRTDDNISITGDFILNKGNIDISGGTLNIHGNLIENDGAIRQEETGSIQIDGDFRQNGGDNLLISGSFSVGGNFCMGEKGEMQDGYRLATSSGNTKLGAAYSGFFPVLDIGGDMIICTSGQLCNSVYNAINLIAISPITLKGSFYQYGNYDREDAAARGYASSNNFICGVVTFAGETTQNIYFDSTDSYFNEVASSNPMLQALSPFNFQLLSSDITIQPNASVENSAVVFQRNSDLNGKTLTVNGNVRHESGILSYHGGKMTAAGNYDLGSKGELSGDHLAATSSGSIDQDDKGILEVGGTFTICTNAASKLDGMVRLAGDLRQYGTFSAADSPLYAFSGDFCPANITFCGADSQYVSFDSPDSILGTAYFENDKVVFESNIRRLSLGSDARVRFGGNETPTEISDLLDLNGHQLTINGSYVQTIGTVFLNKGCLHITGDYSIGQKGTFQGDYRLATSCGTLLMVNAEDFLYVDGNFTICSSTDYSANPVLTDGFMYIRGDFSQYGDSPGDSNLYASAYNFIASGNHKVILDGSGIQKVFFESDYSHFNKLELKQPLSNYDLSRQDCCNDLIYNEIACISPIDDYIYTGKEITPYVTINYGGAALTEGRDYTLSFGNNINAADKSAAAPPTVFVTYINGKEGQTSATFTILQKDVSDEDISVQVSDMTYTGLPVTPEPIVTYGEFILTKDIDYALSYLNNTDGGMATLIITGLGNFTGTAAAKFEIILPDIERKPINNLSVSSIPDMIYTGEQLKPSVSVFDGETQLKEDTDYTLTYFDNVNAGHAAVIIRGVGFYTGINSAPFLIRQRELNASGITVEPIAPQTFTGKAICPSVTVKADGILLKEGRDYMLSYTGNTNTSSNKPASVTIKGKGNCKGSLKTTFPITPASLRAAENNDLSIVVFDAAYKNGKEVKTTVIITDGAYKLKANKDYTLSYTNNIEAGSNAMVSIIGKGNYAGSMAVKRFRIYESVMSSALTISKIAPQTYTGTSIRPEVSVSCYGAVLSKEYYTVSYGTNINAGKGTIYVTGIGEFAGTKTITFTINKKPLASGVTVRPVANMDYARHPHTPELAVYDGNRRLILNQDYSVKYTNNTNAGTARAIITGKGNYRGTLSQSFSIRPATLSENDDPDLNILVSSAVYKNGNAVKPAVIIFDGNTILKEKKDYTLSYSNNTQLSDGTGDSAPSVTITGKGNYEGSSITKTFPICENNISAVTVSAVPAQSFTGLQIKPEVTVIMKKTGETLTAGEDYTLEYGENRRTGTGYIFIMGKGNYGGSKTLKFKIQ